MNMAKHLLLLVILSSPVAVSLWAETKDFYDRAHYSATFDELRHYRIILPRNYETSTRHYPVIYYFHGHSGRYKGEQLELIGDR